MSAPEMNDETDKITDNSTEEERNDDSVASKLSKELSNWRRKRTSSRPRRPDGPAQNFSEPARTIKVRGHETLVVRKSKVVTKPTSNHSPSDQ